jgi:hypothetical protein
MRKLSFGRQVTAVALMLATILTFTALPTSAQQKATPATTLAASTEFTATTAKGTRVQIITSESAGTIEIKLKSGTTAERAFKFTATELSALVTTWREQKEATDQTAATLACLKEFRAAATETVDEQALDELTRQVGASDVMTAGYKESRTAGLTFVKAAAGGASAMNSPCYDLALLDYQVCTAQGGGGFGCMLEALSTLLVCGIFF